jgi:signal transduction histidine kinase
MAEFVMTSEEAHRKRLVYLKVVYLIGLATSVIYILRFNFEYGVSIYNTELLTMWALLLVLPPLFLYYYRNFLLSAISACTLQLGLVIYLLYLSGGVDAPGVFWLAGVPLVTAILLGFRGAVMGYTILCVTMAFFWYSKVNGTAPTLILSKLNYGYEKLFNIFTFLVFASYTTHHYIQGEQKFAKRLAEKNTDVENLLRMLLHDIANTLSSMTLNLLKVREGDQDHSAAGNEIEKIEKAVEDINSLLAQVRHLKSVKDGKATLPLQPLPLQDLIYEVAASTQSFAWRKGIRVALDLSPEMLVIQGERTILANIVLTNLIHNAVKFSHKGERIDLRAFQQESWAVVEIQDYGIGIPEELLEQIFNLNSPTTRIGTQGEKGTGYGMPLVKEYLQMMGGSIDISSHENPTANHSQGTKVSLRFPIIISH